MPDTAEISLCQLALVILVLPLVGFLIQTFCGSKLPRKGDWVPTLFILGSFCIACYMVLQLLGSEHGIEAQRWYPDLGENWLSIEGESAGGFTLHFGVFVDNLTIVMLFVVTLVSLLVHLYSWGYMHGEARYNYFFAYLGLFSFAMLGLCITSNLLFLFIFWELVGLCSYFLIGFYFEKKSASNAAIKAFMTTRIGDIGFFIAILVIASQVGSLEFQAIFASLQQPGVWTPALLAFAGIALFFGPIGKSAQFPLHVWLPDAMEGPTPVSALIHAATMVAAGVYLVGRMFPFLAGPGYFDGNFMASEALTVVAFVGAFTAFFAATIAFSQGDIKKVLAYSTISQLGYMMLGLGVGSVFAGLFHLTTHAFFKALLFLGSGSVIHAVHSNEMDDMGGLRKKMPITYITFAIGTLAIAGMPLLSGFYSKDAILAQAYAFADHKGSFVYMLPFLLGIVTAGMTCFYMFRMFFKTFHGEPRNQKAFDHAHESPWTMTLPLCVLAFLSVVAGGLIGTSSSHWFEYRVASEWLLPHSKGEVFTAVSGAYHHAHELTSVPLAATAMFLVGLGAAALFFLPKGPFYGRDLVGRGALAGVNTFLKNLWYLDRIYTSLVLHVLHVLHFICGKFDANVVDGIVKFWGRVCHYFSGVVGYVDYKGVDGTVRGIGDSTLWSGSKLKRLQTGLLQQYVYASVFLFAGIFLVAFLIYLFRHPGLS